MITRFDEYEIMALVESSNNGLEIGSKIKLPNGYQGEVIKFLLDNVVCRWKDSAGEEHRASFRGTTLTSLRNSGVSDDLTPEFKEISVTPAVVTSDRTLGCDNPQSLKPHWLAK